MTNFKWLRRTSSPQPDRRKSRQFTPRVGGLEDRISLSHFNFGGIGGGILGGGGAGGTQVLTFGSSSGGGGGGTQIVNVV